MKNNEKPKVLITRPKSAAVQLERTLGSMGFDPVSVPLLRIEKKSFKQPEAAKLGCYYGYVFTSVHGVRALDLSKPVFVVGQQTAQAAKDAGYTDIRISADGAATGLAALLEDVRSDHAEARFLYLSARHTSYDFKDYVDRFVTYEAVVLEETETLAEAIKAIGPTAFALFYSKRTAQQFCHLINCAKAQNSVQHIRYVCMSEAIASVLKSHGFTHIYTAPEVSSKSLLALLQEINNKKKGTIMSETFKKAKPVIAKFGGIRPMASKLNIPVTTVQGWKKRDAIPDNRTKEILAAAREHNIDLSKLVASNSNETMSAPTASATPVAEKDVSKDVPTKEAPSATTHKTQAARSVREELPDPMRDEKVYQGEEASKLAGAYHKENMRLSWLGGSAIAIALIALVVAFFAFDMGQENEEDLEAAFVDIEMQLNQTATAQDVLLREQNALSSRVGTLEERSGTSEDAAADFLDLKNDIEAMKESLSETSDIRQAYAQLEYTVANLRDSVEDMRTGWANIQSQAQEYAAENNISAKDIKAAAMLISLTQIRKMLDRQTPFAQDLELMIRWFGSNNDPELIAALERLTPYAEKGVLSTEGLKKELSGLSSEIITASIQGRDVSVTDRAMARLNQIVKVQKDGAPVSGFAEDKVLADAQAMLDQDNVSGAMAQLRTLDPNAMKVLEPWFNQAKGNLAMKDLEKLLSGRLIGLMNSGSAPLTGTVQ
ncbi:MAG TPA: hypothetical protein DHW10_07165 [Rhodospirillaceae bacterium]|nr:hypothetical protein [Rhodospirillaceae bacterium]